MRSVTAIAVLLLLSSGTAWAGETPSITADNLMATAPRNCIDAAGHQAVCGPDPSNPIHECRAADGFGSCPQDPKCFREDGLRVRCVRPVTVIRDDKPRPKPKG
jgi:hypothetical protein